MGSETRSASESSAEPELERGVYAVLRDRLVAKGRELAERAHALNEARVALFGSSELRVLDTVRIRTENNCIPRDIVGFGSHLLVGFDVFIGLRSAVQPQDVFCTYRRVVENAAISFEPVTPDEVGLCGTTQFERDFAEIHSYYRDAKLVQLRVPGDRLLAIFRTGSLPSDRKALRWQRDGDRLEYLDNAGIGDHVVPPSHDFEWTQTSREQHVDGRNPHISILDKIFVETVGGDLTIKIENNTDTGQGIYAEPVDDPNQSLHDAEVWYAQRGSLILLKIRPYREDRFRYLVFNAQTCAVSRIDAIGSACIELPDDHGIIFPGGYHLQTGETRTFEGEVDGMVYLRSLRAPNGEDVLYVFYEAESGQYVLLAYNAIRRELANPIHCNGYCVHEDGTIAILRSRSADPARVHAIQLWATPFGSEEQAASNVASDSFLGKIGNSDLVRAISDSLSLQRVVESEHPTRQSYEAVVDAVQRMLDQYHWLDHAEVGIGTLARELGEIAENAIGEFEKILALRAKADDAVQEAAEELAGVFASLHPEVWDSLHPYVEALAQLRRQRGMLISMRELRHVDLERLAELEAELEARDRELSSATIDYLLEADALAPYMQRADACAARVEAADTVAAVDAVATCIDELKCELEVLNEVVASLRIEDSTIRTRILEEVSAAFGALNRSRAVVTARRSELRERESGAEFAAEFNLLAQAITAALAQIDSAEKCDAELSRLLVRIEELEGRFGEFDSFVAALVEKREDVYEAFSSRKQSLLDARQRQADQAMRAAERVLTGVARRAKGFDEPDLLQAYFATDPMVAKARELASLLRELGDSVRADEVDGRLKSVREDASRALRDRRDIFEDGSAVIRLGTHRFSVNQQPLELTLVPRDGEMFLHMSGTDYFERVGDPEFSETRTFWDQNLPSETPDLYRAEYLAGCLLLEAAESRGGAGLVTLAELSGAGELLPHIREQAAERYEEGYERGVHDVDAAQILEAALRHYRSVGLLRFEPRIRARACLFWAFLADVHGKLVFERHAQSLSRLRAAFGDFSGVRAFERSLASSLEDFFSRHEIEFDPYELGAIAEYLFEELARSEHDFVASAEARELVAQLRGELRQNATLNDFEEDLRALENDLSRLWELSRTWILGWMERHRPDGSLVRFADEAAALLLTERSLNRYPGGSHEELRVEGLLGQHPRIDARRLGLRLDELLARVRRHRDVCVPGYRAYHRLRSELVERAREELRLREFEPRVLASFVRNRLIDEVYLPIIGNNLAKQIGALGDKKRTDLMGLLLLISPPGYGKTTLMEYVADRLGLIFVKVNGPALGHTVVSLDPAQVPNAGARQEVEKINLALEMGSNILLYLDDIQHTSSELLQKFISLCDGQRRIEGVWRGRSKTYDLRGKRFCVCMAGNPYTESGEKFQIPDMLANRADIYNLGDVLSGRESLFELSYIENALTSNPVLSPLSTRDPRDVVRLVRLARGAGGEADELSHDYAPVELDEILSVLRRLLRVQEVLLAVNREYIRSASMDDAFRTEPPFKLQGSYRNMNKIAEQVVSVMTEDELEALIDDHYQGEAQTLTSGAEHNLLKLKQLRGVMSESEVERWQQILRDFERVKLTGGESDDPAARVSGQIGLLSERLEAIRAELASSSRLDGATIEAALQPLVSGLGDHLAAVSRALLSPPQSDRMFEDMAPLVAGLEAISQTIASAAPGEAADSVPLGLYLDKLDQTLQTLATAPRRGEIVQSLGPGVKDLLEKMVQKIKDLLIPTLHEIERRAGLSSSDARLKADLNKTLKHFDMLRDLLDALQRIDTRELVRRVQNPPGDGRAPARESGDER